MDSRQQASTLIYFGIISFSLQARLTAGEIVVAGTQDAGRQPADECAALPFLLSGRFPAGGLGAGTFSILAPDHLDPDPQAQIDTGGDIALHLRLSLPQNF
jgi:hypothetical protein